MADGHVTRTVSIEQKLDGARQLRGLILRHREQSDEARQLAQPVAEAMAGLGLFRSMVPESAGGEEWDLPTWIRIVEELSTVDGAVGWIAGVGGSVNGIFSGWLSGGIARAVFCGDPIGLSAGTMFKGGKAKRADGGYTVSGRWPFASSTPHATWFVGAAQLEGAAPGLGPTLFFPRRDVEIIDTWSVGGMRGTGSHDFTVREVFVPADYSFDAVTDPPLHPGPLYRLPVRLTLSAGLGPLVLGLARGAINAFVELMKAKVDRFTGTGLRDRMTVQERVAQAEAALRAARAFLYEMVQEVWGTVENGAALTEQQIEFFRLANIHAVASGARAVDLVYHAAGTSSIFTTSLLERFFRDVHVATQHRMASPEEVYQVGRVLLGAPER